MKLAVSAQRRPNPEKLKLLSKETLEGLESLQVIDGLSCVVRARMAELISEDPNLRQKLSSESLSSLVEEILSPSTHRDIATLVQNYIQSHNSKRMNVLPVKVSEGTLEALEISRSVDAPSRILRPHVEEILRADSSLRKKLDRDEISLLAEIICAKENTHKKIEFIFADFLANTSRAGNA